MCIVSHEPFVARKNVASVDRDGTSGHRLGRHTRKAWPPTSECSLSSRCVAMTCRGPSETRRLAGRQRRRRGLLLLGQTGASLIAQKGQATHALRVIARILLSLLTCIFLTQMRADMINLYVTFGSFLRAAGRAGRPAAARRFCDVHWRTAAIG